jgi:hypothetical protein
MTKKQVSKKKINIKLKPYEAFVIMQTSELLSIAELLESALRKEEDKQSKSKINDLALRVRLAINENQFIPQEQVGYDEWE